MPPSRRDTHEISLCTPTWKLACISWRLRDDDYDAPARRRLKAQRRAFVTYSAALSTLRTLDGCCAVSNDKFDMGALRSSQIMT